MGRTGSPPGIFRSCGPAPRAGDHGQGSWATSHQPGQAGSHFAAQPRAGHTLQQHSRRAASCNTASRPGCIRTSSVSAPIFRRTASVRPARCLAARRLQAGERAAALAGARLAQSSSELRVASNEWKRVAAASVVIRTRTALGRSGGAEPRDSPAGARRAVPIGLADRASPGRGRLITREFRRRNGARLALPKRGVADDALRNGREWAEWPLFVSFPGIDAKGLGRSGLEAHAARLQRLEQPTADHPQKLVGPGTSTESQLRVSSCESRVLSRGTVRREFASAGAIRSRRGGWYVPGGLVGGLGRRGN